MFHFHHHNHLWVALTRHHELESILIGYPFRALSSRPRVILLIYDLESLFLFRVVSSWPKVIFLIYDPKSFFPFRALSSWPGVIHFIYDPKSFLAFIALSSQPRVVYPIYDLESFILFPTQSRLSYFWPRVVHLVHDRESFISSMNLSHPFHLFPSLCYSSHTFLSLLPFPHIELFHPCRCSPMFRLYSHHVLRGQNGESTNMLLFGRDHKCRECELKYK